MSRERGSWFQRISRYFVDSTHILVCLIPLTSMVGRWCPRYRVETSSHRTVSHWQRGWITTSLQVLKKRGARDSNGQPWTVTHVLYSAVAGLLLLVLAPLSALVSFGTAVSPFHMRVAIIIDSDSVILSHGSVSGCTPLKGGG